MKKTTLKNLMLGMGLLGVMTVTASASGFTTKLKHWANQLIAHTEPPIVKVIFSPSQPLQGDSITGFINIQPFNSSNPIKSYVEAKVDGQSIALQNTGDYFWVANIAPYANISSHVLTVITSIEDKNEGDQIRISIAQLSADILTLQEQIQNESDPVVKSQLQTQQNQKINQRSQYQQTLLELRREIASDDFNFQVIENTSSSDFPHITQITPGYSIQSGSTDVTISGSGFTSQSTVYLSGVQVSASFINSTSLMVTIPPAVIAGLKDVEVRVPAGSTYKNALLKNGFLVVAGTSPAGLTYALNPAIYTKGAQIQNNTPSLATGSANSYTIQPNLPAGMLLNTSTGVISGTPTVVTPLVPYTITATNYLGSTSAVLNILVNDIVPSNFSYAHPLAIYTKGTSITPNAPVVSGGAPTSYSIDHALPAGLTFNTATGVISGTPTQISTQGIYTITAFNSGGSVQASISILVNDQAPTSLTYQSNSPVYIKGSVIQSNYPAQGGGVATKYTVTPDLPMGLNLDSTLGVISGSPFDVSAPTNYLITASNTGGSITKTISIEVKDVAHLSLSDGFFPDTQHGHSSGSVVFTVTNDGSSIASISQIGFINGSQFTKNGGTCSTSTVLIPGGSCTISVVFNPIAVGILKDTLSLSYQNGAATAYAIREINGVGIDLPPAQLTYTVSPAIYSKDVAIVPNSPHSTGGEISYYSILPALPAGLTLNASTGVISGTATVAAPSQDYIIVGTNSGGSTTVHLPILVIPGPSLLNVNLVSVNPDPSDPSKVIVVGAMGATTLGTQVTVKAGFLNSDSIAAVADGSFILHLSYFQSGTISAHDAVSGITETYTLNYATTTSLSGVVKDNEGRPLANAKVTLADPSVVPVYTNGSGVFSFNDTISGDQTLLVSGAGVLDPCTTCSARSFVGTAVKLTIGLKQANVLERPIFLNPLYADAVAVPPSQGITVTSTRAPGVELNIPAGSIVGQGSNSIKVSIEKTIAANTTVTPPDFAQPENVVSLEPAGLTFNQPVQVTVPNDDELPVGTNMIIMSYDSSKGTWGPDGVAVVNADGTTITTKPSMGIHHFSSIYAIPTGAQVTQFGSQDKPGANTFDGAVSTSISLPSYQSLGVSRSPSLYYKSAWAKPNVVVSNLFDIPRNDVTVTAGGTGGIFGYTIADVNATVRAFVSPEQVTSQFNTGAYHSPTLTFTGVPNKAAISYGFDLTGSESGVYPWASHWEFKLKHTVIKTVVTRSRKYAFFGPLTQNGDPKVTDESFSELFPQDFGGLLYVQNKSASTAGSGWKVGGVQKIVNPASDRIMLEESDGAIATYNVNNTITSLKTLSSSDFSLADGARVQWPYLYVANNSNPTQVSTFDLSNNASTSVAKTQSIQSIGGVISENLAIHFGGSIPDYHYLYEHAFRIVYKFADFFAQNNGPLYSLSANTSSLYKSSDNSSSLDRIIGNLEAPQTFVNSGSAPVNAYCASFGVSCPVSAEYAKDQVYGSFGQIPSVGTGGNVLSNARLNNPKGIASNPLKPTLVIADTGNHRVVEVNLNTQAVTVIAGDGSLHPKVDEVSATTSSLIRPVAVTYDSVGGLYILTSEGYVRYVDPTGVIHTKGGLPDSDPNSVIDNRTLSKFVSLSNPSGMVLDEKNAYLYISDTGHNRVLAMDVSAGGNYTNVIAGSGGGGFSGDNGAALAAQLNSPTGLALDPNGSLLIVDSGNNRVRKVTFGNLNNNTITFAPTNRDNSTLAKNLDGSGWTRTYRDGSKVFFDANGKEVIRQDRQLRQVRSQYNSNGDLERQIDPTGLQTIYHYASGGKLSDIQDPTGKVTRFYYDLMGKKLQQVVFPDNSTSKYEYDSDGLLTKEINQNNQATAYSYNAWSRLEQVIRPDNTVITVNDSITGTMSNNYGSGQNGTLKPISDATFADKVTDANQVTTEMKKDQSGYISKIKDPLGKVTRIERNDQGQPIHIYRNFIENDETTTTDDQWDSAVDYTYNSFGDLIKTVDSETNLTKLQTYNNFGDVVSETSEAGVTTTHTYNESVGLEKSVSNDVQGELGTIQYGSVYLLKTVEQSPSGSRSVYGYDTIGNLISTTQKIDGANSAITLLLRDAAGNVITSTSPDNKVTHYEYDAWNRLTAVISPKNERTDYIYSPTGKLLQVKDHHNETITFTYDSLDRVATKTDQLGKTYTYTYDGNANLLTQTDPNGFTNQFAYDNLNQLKTKTTSQGVTSFTYNDQGKVLSAISPSVGLGFTYDSNTNKILTQASTIGRGSYASKIPSALINYHYNGLKELDQISKADTNYNVALSHDSLGRLQSASGTAGNFGMMYDAMNRLISINQTGTGSQITRNFGYDTQGFLTSLTSRVGSSGSIISQQLYGRDYSGMRTGVNSTSGSQTVNRSLAYDNNHQLTGVAYTATGTNQAYNNESYAYDSTYNRTSDEGGSYTYDSHNQRLTEDYKYNYFYDENGNLIKKQLKGNLNDVTSYSYNSENQMIGFKVFDSSSTTVPVKEVTYVYDPMGRRLLKEIVDHATPANSYSRGYVYHSNEIIEEFDGSQNLLAQYGHSNLRTDDPLSMKVTSSGVSAGLAPSSSTYTFLKDAQGSITEVIDSNADIVQRYHYNSFGKIMSIRNSGDADVTSSPTIKTPFAFTGREYDEESGNYYYRARYYNPDKGRFLQQDPHPGTVQLPQTMVNSYAYTANNPWNLADASGKSFFADLLVGIGVGLLAIVSGGTVLGALSAVGSIAGGALAASMLQAAFQGGNFWQNVGKNFDANFMISAAFFGISILGADLFGGGLVKVGGNGLQGFSQSANSILGGGGLTIGSAATFTGVDPLDLTKDGITTFAQHEFGHTLQFLGMSALGGAAHVSMTGIWGTYLGLGGLGLTPAGAWWESNASALGRAF